MLDVEEYYALSLDPETGEITVIPVENVPLRGYVEPPWERKNLHNDPEQNRAIRAKLAGAQ